MQIKENSLELDLTRSQMLIWAGQKMSPLSPMYNMALSFQLFGEIEPAVFRRSFLQLIHVCDAMRTVFFTINDQPRQRVSQSFVYDMEYLDWTQKPDNRERLEEWLKHKSQHLFDLSECLFESVLIKLADEHYVWYFNQHHLITDAWGMSLQYKTMSDLYQHSLTSDGPARIQLPRFSDYIQDRIKTACSPNPLRLEHWALKTKSLTDPPKLFGYQNMHSGTESERISITVPGDLTTALKDLHKDREIRVWTVDLTIYNIFSTILLAYLYRISGQKSIAFGSPAHNRTNAQLRQTPGLFIEVFPIASSISPDQTFMDLYSQVRDETNSLLKNAEGGYSTSGLNRGVNVILNYINAVFGSFGPIEAACEWIHSGHADPGHLFRLQVHNFNADGSIVLSFDLNTQVFSEEKRREIPGQFLRLMQSFLENRKQKIGEPSLFEGPIPPLRGPESADGKRSNASVLDLFQKQVQLVPKNTAVVSGSTMLTYRDLDVRSNRLAQYLIVNKTLPGDRILIHLNRSLDFIVAVWGVLKAGGTFIPVPTNYPSGRIRSIIQDAQAKLLVTSSHLSTQLQDTHSHIVNLDLEAGFIQQSKDVSPEVKISRDDLAYIMYTSGSTGLPKGVMISHRALSHYIQWSYQRYCIDDVPNIPLFTSIGFDLTITSLFMPLIGGGMITTYPEPAIGPDLAIYDVLEDNMVNMIKLTPTHLSLIRSRDLSNCQIKSIIVGGEALESNLTKEISTKLSSPVKIFNEYGPTEATVGCIVHEFKPDEGQKRGTVPIGLPISDTEVYLLDEYLNQVPSGTAGEIYLGGPGLAHGYWNQQVLTSEKFIGNPFRSDRSILYATGDLARLNEDNVLEYLGRVDMQVKVGGRRIELEEIQSRLVDHPRVTQAIVTLRTRHRDRSKQEVQFCSRCGLPSNYPGAKFDDEGVCHLCLSFTSYQQKVKAYFKTPADLKALFEYLPEHSDRSHDCIMLLSGGKDSTYALARLKDMGLRVLAFTLDNGYISEEAKANIQRVVETLEVDHIYGMTDAMNAIFVDSLQRHCNVCDGCFKTIYTLSINLALERNIPFIVTGLSRGQFFETRLTEELFVAEDVETSKIDETILNARQAYHQVDDAVKRLLDVSAFSEESTFDRVRFIDFYRYSDVSLDDMLTYLDQQLPWVRPTDTGRSTNCLINKAGIYVHKKERGYSNYAFPYSWDVRIGHKTRQASLEEINEEIDPMEAETILDEIGFTSENSKVNDKLVAYVKCETQVTEVELRNHLLAHLPEYMVPVQFIQIDEIPITPNSKIDYDALPVPDAIRPLLKNDYVEPATEFEKMVAEIWSDILRIDRIGIHDTFLEIGGDSLTGIRIMARINEAFALELPVNIIFQEATIHRLANKLEETIDLLLLEMDE